MLILQLSANLPVYATERIWGRQGFARR